MKNVSKKLFSLLLMTNVFMAACDEKPAPSEDVPPVVDDPNGGGGGGGQPTCLNLKGKPVNTSDECGSPNDDAGDDDDTGGNDDAGDDDDTGGTGGVDDPTSGGGTDDTGGSTPVTPSAPEDTTPPANPSISIDGNLTQFSKTLTLTLSASEASMMMVSDSSNCSSGSWEAYNVTKNFTTANSGYRTISVKYKDDAGNESGCVSDYAYILDIVSQDLTGLLSVGDSFTFARKGNEFAYLFHDQDLMATFLKVAPITNGLIDFTSPVSVYEFTASPSSVMFLSNALYTSTVSDNLEKNIFISKTGATWATNTIQTLNAVDYSSSVNYVFTNNAENTVYTLDTESMGCTFKPILWNGSAYAYDNANFKDCSSLAGMGANRFSYNKNHDIYTFNRHTTTNNMISFNEYAVNPDESFDGVNLSVNFSSDSNNMIRNYFVPEHKGNTTLMQVIPSSYFMSGENGKRVIIQKNHIVLDGSGNVDIAESNVASKMFNLTGDRSIFSGGENDGGYAALLDENHFMVVYETAGNIHGVAVYRIEHNVLNGNISFAHVEDVMPEVATFMSPIYTLMGSANNETEVMIKLGSDVVKRIGVR